MTLRAVEQTRDAFRNWRNWEVMDWLMAIFTIVVVGIVMLFVVALLSGSSGIGPHAEEGDTRVQRYECTWIWSAATKTSQRHCNWQTLDYQR